MTRPSTQAVTATSIEPLCVTGGRRRVNENAGTRRDGGMDRDKKVAH